MVSEQLAAFFGEVAHAVPQSARPALRLLESRIPLNELLDGGRSVVHGLVVSFMVTYVHTRISRDASSSSSSKVPGPRCKIKVRLQLYIGGRVVYCPSFVMCGKQWYMAQLAGLWTETVLYGINATLFGASVHALLHKARIRYYLLASTVVFALCTVVMVLDFLRILLTPDATANSQVIQGAALSCSTETEERFREALISALLEALIDAGFAAALFIADGVLIFRLFVLYQMRYRKWIVFSLLVLYLAMTACNIAAVFYDVRIYRIRLDTPLNQDPVSAAWTAAQTQYSIVAEAGYAFTLATNVIASSLIAWQIWIMKRELERSLGKGAVTKYRAAMTMMIQSGILLSFVFVITLITFFEAPIYASIPNDAALQIIGIVPTLIVLQVGRGSDAEPLHSTIQHDHTSQLPSPTIRFAEHTNHGEIMT